MKFESEKFKSEMIIKADVYQGVRIDRTALEDVGTKYQENVYSVFDYNAEYLGAEIMYPSSVKFPLGSVVLVRHDPRSPYLIRKEDSTLILERNGEFVTTVEWIERPAFYDRLTSDGVEMKKIGQMAGECGLLITFSNYCYNWVDGNQCHYCNINATMNAHKDSIIGHKTVEHCGETAAAFLEEIPDGHIFLVSGFMPGVTTTEACVAIMESIKSHSGLERLPICLNIAPPSDLSDIDRLYKAGAQGVLFDLEVWDPNMFKAICPGKSKNIGREHFLRALEYSVSIFGEGHVWSNFVQGLEERGKYYQAAEYLAERGIMTSLQPWFPAIGSKLEGHRAPYPEWMVDVTEGVVSAMAKSSSILLTEEFFKSAPMGCYRCFIFGLVLDEVRKRLGGLEIERIKDSVKI